MLLSYVIAAYRKPERLEMCLASIANQVFTDHEIIVADDGSPGDETRIIAEKYGARFFTHERSVYKGRPTRNMPWVMNTGVGAAQGVVVQTLQEDHVLAPDFGLWLVRSIRPASVVFGLTDHSRRAFTHDDLATMLRTLHLPDGEVRFEKYFNHSRSSLMETPDWRLMDGLDAAFYRELWGEGLDSTFIGQGHEWLDRMLQWRISDMRFFVNPFMRLYHQDEDPAPDNEVWGSELEESYGRMQDKYGFDVWTVNWYANYPLGTARPTLDAKIKAQQ